MPSLIPSTSVWLPCLILLVFWARPTAAFGAGNIASLSSVEGHNWRHGDIEDVLLSLLISERTGKKFSKMDVKRVYFGNWLRDYSQAVDVGTVKAVSAEAIRILLWVLGFMSFGYGTKEFEVTRDRLGCYRPEEHIDNPKDYADNLDARDYDRRLRAPVDERRELSIDPRTGLKSYIASEDQGITTSAGMVRDLLRRCIDLGQRSGGRGPDFYEALRLLGTATHCLEDFSAHSNYTELALLEIGMTGDREDQLAANVFPHVGRDTLVQLEGSDRPVYPIVTGTFGGVDFLHSVCGELSDKATQSELTELEGAISDADRKQNKSQIKDLLSQLPDGIFGGKDQGSKADELEQNAQAAQMGNVRITPKEPEEFTQQIGELVKQIYPIMEFHDEIMQSIAEFIENIPMLPELIEQVQDQVTIFVFSLLAPYVLPILNQVKAELETGSSEVIASAREKQHIVFNDDNCTDPTHSMLSKDHFTNILNAPAGRVAAGVVKWTVPQIVRCWDGQADPETTIDNIIRGVFHHPAQRGNLGNRDPSTECRMIMFDTVRSWWDNLDSKRNTAECLSRNGVENGDNHDTSKGGDTGHGCCKPIGMANDFSGTKGSGGNKQFQQVSEGAGKLVSEAVGGGAIGDLAAGLVGGIGGSLLGGAFGGDEKKSKKTERYDDDGSYTQTYSESGHHKKKSHDDTERYGQAEYQQTQYASGSRREDYTRREHDQGGDSYSYQQRVETSVQSTGGYERHEERRVESGNRWESDDRREGYTQQGEYYNDEKKTHGKKYGKDSEDEESNEDDDYEKRQKKERKRREKEEKKRYKKHGSGNEDSDEDGHKRRSGEYERKSHSPKRRSGDYPRNSGYGEERQYGEGRREGYGGGSGGYGDERQQAAGYGGDSYSSGRQESSGYGADSYSSGGGYGTREESSGYGRQESSGYGRPESSGYGGDSYNSGGGYGGRQEPSGYGGSNEGGEYGGRRDDFDQYGQRQQYGGGGDGGYGNRY